MKSQGRNSHYVHMVEHPHSQRSIIKAFHSFEKDGYCLQIAIANHNTIEIYKNIGSSVVYDKTCSFMCDITVMEVLPVKESSDILFLADELGRFMFWSATYGVISTHNTIRAPEFQTPIYLKVPAEDRQPQYSGIYCNFNVLDTEASIFFTISTKIIILRVKWSKGQILYINPPVQLQCPYLDIKYMGIVGAANGKQPYIGIIEQREQKTFLRFHRINSENFQCAFSIQKANLTNFYSNFDGQQIVTVTNTQINIFNMKNQQIFCTFQITQSGFVSALDNQLYIYMGELGSQMIVFNKKHYKNYGSFMLENQVCMKLSTLGKLVDGGFLIAFIDQGHTVQFIALYQQTWKSIRSIFSTCSIFSIEDMGKNKECLAVVRAGQNIHQVGIISKKISPKMQRQTPIKIPILGLFSTNNGKAIIISNSESNTVFTYSDQYRCFESGFQFQPGVIVKVVDKFIVMEHKIYRMDINQNSKNNIKQLLVEKSGIVAADFSGTFIGYQCSDSNFKFYNTQTNQVDRIRKNCVQEYIWKFHSSNILLVASLNLPGKLKIVPVFKQQSVVDTACSQIISDIASIQQEVFISYNNCQIFIYEFQGMSIKKIIDCSSQPLQLIKCLNSILAYGANQAFILKFHKQNWKIQQIQFDPSKQVSNLIFLPAYNKFVVSHQESIALYSISKDRPEEASSFRVVSMNVDSHLPFATIKDKIVYIIQNYQIIMRNVHTAELLKKQSHGLKEICCIQKLQVGLLVCGVNDMDTAQIFLFDYKDLQILCFENVQKNESFDKKIPTAVIKKDRDSFFIREQNTISLYEIKNNSIKQVFCSRTGLIGYTLAIQPQISMLMASDPLRYLVAYDYRLNKLVSLCRYQGLNTINDIQFLQCSAVVGDNTGNLAIVQFNFDKSQVLRTSMTKVASLKVGSQIIYIKKGKQGVIYSTISGSVGRFKSINYQSFSILKYAQKQALNYLERSKNQLKYQQWANRFDLCDKLIDGHLIEYFITNSKGKDSKYDQVAKVWAQIKEKQ